MSAWQKNLYYLKDQGAPESGYARAKLWALPGVRVGTGVVVETDCRIDRPWGVTIGDR